MKEIYEAARALLAFADEDGIAIISMPPQGERFKAIMADLRAACANNGWRPIETLPKGAGYVIEEEDRWVISLDGEHWQPVPPPPEAIA